MSGRIIVIGAGTAGLTCAWRLAAAGRTVVVLEKNAVPGGYAGPFPAAGVDADIRLPGFCSQGVILPLLAEMAVLLDLAVQPAAWCLNVGGRRLGPGGLSDYADGLAAMFPQAASGIRSYFAAVDALLRSLRRLLMPHPLQQPRRLWHDLAFCAVHPLALARLVAACRRTVGQELRRHIADPAVAELLSRLGYPDFAAALAAGMWHMFTGDYWQPRGGLRALTRLMAQRCLAEGAVIRYNTRVVQLITAGRQVRGVLCADGERIAGDCIVATVDYRRLFSRLLPPSGRQRNWAALRPSTPYSTVVAQLNLSPLQRRSLAAVHHYLPDIPALPAGAVVSFPQCLDATVHTVYVSLAGVRDAAAARHAARQALQRLGVTDGGDFHVITPADYAVWNDSPDGASAGWDMHPAVLRHTLWTGWKTPWRNLLYAGHWAMAPGGMPAAMLSGCVAARVILRQQ